MEEQLCLHHIDLPSGKSQMPRVAITIVSTSFLCQENSALFSPSFPWGQLPLSHLLSSAYLAIPHQQDHFFKKTYTWRQFHEAAWSVVLKKIIKFRHNPK